MGEDTEMGEEILKENPEVKKETAHFVRFNTRQRIEHILLMLVFTALSATGLAQRFYDLPAAQWLILGLGGGEAVRLAHRILGIVFTLGILYHVGFIVFSLLARHNRLSMFPNFKDFRDIVTEMKYLTGFTKERALFGRYDYRQKFEYIGLMFGSVILILSGFVLMFPVIIATLLSGQALAAAIIFHGFEATLAVLTIIVWHFYDVIFKPGVFPGDFSIFTGKISAKRMQEEHPLEYEEIAPKP